ncbi:MAG: FAD-binding oxidoreductase, partial [Phycisphaeraceae bacterium]
EPAGADVLRVRLEPLARGECFCEFVPGQYLELWRPDSDFMSRAYSIANAPEGDGSVELHLRRVEGGRFTSWAFSGMKVGDRLKARGPLGNFTMRSRPETPLLFAAGGTGLAPILALLRQQVRSQPQRDMVLVWGMKRSGDFYALPELVPILEQAPRLRIVLAADEGAPSWPPRERLSFVQGTVTDVLDRDEALLAGRDIYAAGPPSMLRALGQQLARQGVARERVHVDSFGV